MPLLSWGEQGGNAPQQTQKLLLIIDKRERRDNSLIINTLF